MVNNINKVCKNCGNETFEREIIYIETFTFTDIAGITSINEDFSDVNDGIVCAKCFNEFYTTDELISQEEWEIIKAKNNYKELTNG